MHYLRSDSVFHSIKPPKLYASEQTPLSDNNNPDANAQQELI